MTFGVRSSADLSLWYRLSYRQLRGLGLGSLMRSRYSNSPFKMLKAVYPEFDWKPWNFEVFPRRISGDQEVLKQCLDHISSSLSITSVPQWYRVSHAQLEALGVLNVVQKNGGLFSCLRKVMPSVQWDESKFVGVNHFGEKLLGACLSQLFPNEALFPNFPLPLSGNIRRVVFSYSIPSIKLLFDYQSQRLYGLERASGNVSVSLVEPTEKLEASEQNGYSIVFIPFWWNREILSLAKTILVHHPHLRHVIVSAGLSGSEVEAATAIPRSEVTRLSKWNLLRTKEHV